MLPNDVPGEFWTVCKHSTRNWGCQFTSSLSSQGQIISLLMLSPMSSPLLQQSQQPTFCTPLSLCACARGNETWRQRVNRLAQPVSGPSHTTWRSCLLQCSSTTVPISAPPSKSFNLRVATAMYAETLGQLWHDPDSRCYLPDVSSANSAQQWGWCPGLWKLLVAASLPPTGAHHPHPVGIGAAAVRPPDYPFESALAAAGSGTCGAGHNVLWLAGHRCSALPLLPHKILSIRDSRHWVMWLEPTYASCVTYGLIPNLNFPRI